MESLSIIHQKPRDLYETLFKIINKHRNKQKNPPVLLSHLANPQQFLSEQPGLARPLEGTSPATRGSRCEALSLQKASVSQPKSPACTGFLEGSYLFLSCLTGSPRLFEGSTGFDYREECPSGSVKGL